MKFWTIWTIPAMSVGERLKRTRDWLAMVVADCLPLRVRYWCTLREIGRATMDSSNVPGTPLEDILKNLDRPKAMS